MCTKCLSKLYGAIIPLEFPIPKNLLSLLTFTGAYAFEIGPIYLIHIDQSCDPDTSLDFVRIGFLLSELPNHTHSKF